MPSSTAFGHAAVFGMTEVIDVLVAAGIDSLEMAAATGDVSAWPLTRLTIQSRIRALVFAADHQRLNVIDQLAAAGTPVNEADAEWGSCPCTPQRVTAGQQASGGCSPTGPTPTSATPRTTPHRWRKSTAENSLGHREAEATLRPLTRSRHARGPDLIHLSRLWVPDRNHRP